MLALAAMVDHSPATIVRIPALVLMLAVGLVVATPGFAADCKFSPKVLSPPGGGKHDVSHLRSGGQKDVLCHDELETFQTLFHLRRVRLGLQRVLTEHIETPEHPLVHRFVHEADVEPCLGGDLGPVDILELDPRVVVLDVLKTARQRYLGRCVVFTQEHRGSLRPVALEECTDLMRVIDAMEVVYERRFGLRIEADRIGGRRRVSSGTSVLLG